MAESLAQSIVPGDQQVPGQWLLVKVHQHSMKTGLRGRNEAGGRGVSRGNLAALERSCDWLESEARLPECQWQKMMMLVKPVFGSWAEPLVCDPEPMSARSQLSVIKILSDELFLSLPLGCSCLYFHKIRVERKVPGTPGDEVLMEEF